MTITSRLTPDAVSPRFISRYPGIQVYVNQYASELSRMVANRSDDPAMSGERLEVRLPKRDRAPAVQPYVALRQMANQGGQHHEGGERGEGERRTPSEVGRDIAADRRRHQDSQRRSGLHVGGIAAAHRRRHALGDQALPGSPSSPHPKP